MNVIPSIDLLDGRPVRLYQGDPSQATFYDVDPVERAIKFEELGARRFHLVNLNGAFGTEGAKENSAIISQIVAKLAIPVQVGGGFRTAQDVKEAIEVGIQGAILGTQALEPDHDLKRLISERYLPIELIADIGFSGDQVLVKGWQEGTGLTVLDAVRRIAESGFGSLVLTNKNRDGAMNGPDLDIVCRVARFYPNLSLIVSGGIASEDHVAQIRNLGLESVSGCILGKRLWQPDGFEFFSRIK